MNLARRFNAGKAITQESFRRVATVESILQTSLRDARGVAEPTRR